MIHLWSQHPPHVFEPSDEVKATIYKFLWLKINRLHNFLGFALSRLAKSHSFTSEKLQIIYSSGAPTT